MLTMNSRAPRKRFVNQLPGSVLVAALVLAAQAHMAVGQAPAIDVNDWPCWRGPTRDGVADPNQKLPKTWSETENLIWSAKVPGRGHGSPIVVGKQIFLGTADHDTKTQLVLCYDRETGKLLWETPVHTGVPFAIGNGKSSAASSTPACDGERVYVNFLHNGAVHTTALGRDGKVVWQKKIHDHLITEGFASSPMIHGDLILVSADHRGGGVIVGLKRDVGERVWEVARPKTPNWTSPIVVRANDKEQLILVGCDLVTSLDPLKGTKHWEITGATTQCVTSTVTDGEHVFTSGGVPKPHVSAVRVDGSGKVAWANNTRVYVPSMVTYQKFLYAVQDSGIAVCWNGATGKEAWKGRANGNFSASLVLVGDTIYGANESGQTLLWKASPEAFTPIGQNKLGDEAMASPAICGGRIYLRHAKKEGGKRQEMLYCVGIR
jgi:outer membrane protein assembly factor BamB